MREYHIYVRYMISHPNQYESYREFVRETPLYQDVLYPLLMPVVAEGRRSSVIMEVVEEAEIVKHSHKVLEIFHFESDFYSPVFDFEEEGGKDNGNNHQHHHGDKDNNIKEGATDNTHNDNKDVEMKDDDLMTNVSPHTEDNNHSSTPLSPDLLNKSIIESPSSPSPSSSDSHSSPHSHCLYPFCRLLPHLRHLHLKGKFLSSKEVVNNFIAHMHKYHLQTDCSAASSAFSSSSSLESNTPALSSPLPMSISPPLTVSPFSSLTLLSLSLPDCQWDSHTHLFFLLLLPLCFPSLVDLRLDIKIWGMRVVEEFCVEGWRNGIGKMRKLKYLDLGYVTLKFIDGIIENLYPQKEKEKEKEKESGSSIAASLSPSLSSSPSPIEVTFRLFPFLSLSGTFSLPRWTESNFHIRYEKLRSKWPLLSKLIIIVSGKGGEYEYCYDVKEREKEKEKETEEVRKLFTFMEIEKESEGGEDNNVERRGGEKRKSEWQRMKSNGRGKDKGLTVEEGKEGEEEEENHREDKSKSTMKQSDDHHIGDDSSLPPAVSETHHLSLSSSSSLVVSPSPSPSPLPNIEISPQTLPPPHRHQRGSVSSSRASMSMSYNAPKIHFGIEEDEAEEDAGDRKKEDGEEN